LSNTTTASKGAFDAFLERYPDYKKTTAIDALRDRQFKRLDLNKHVYLDYTGSGLYGENQVAEHCGWLRESVLGNPHSESPTSVLSTNAVEACRRRVLEFFKASSAEYEVVFTANASQALKLVGESYPFRPGGRFLLTFDNHNSVNGIREYDRARGARTDYVPLVLPDLRADEGKLEQLLGEADPDRDNLFAFPAQSNFSGVRHPLEWIEKAQDQGWDVLLDAAAYVPTARLDLSRWHPDFVALSFYKMFGYPTGVGVLVAKKKALEKLHRPWFSGGTIRVASVQADRYLPAAAPAAFEDGTLDFTSIPAVSLGLDQIDSIGYETLGLRVKTLTGWLLETLRELKHKNGAPLVKIYGPETTDSRGSTIALNFFDSSGVQIDQSRVELEAKARQISVRTGCFCNPGAGELCLGITAAKMDACMDENLVGVGCADVRRCLDPQGAGAIRVSFGLVSNFEDAQAFVELSQHFAEA